jgi:hypothetical protein
MSKQSESQEVEDRYRKILNRPESAKLYAEIKSTQDGKILDVDLARELCPEYASGIEGRKKWTEATNEPAWEFIKSLYEIKLKPNPNGQVVFLAGGSGSGKSTVSGKLLEDVFDLADIVCDGTFSTYETARDRIQMAINSGRPVQIVYIHRPFEDAVRGVFARYKLTGRWVPADVLAKSHAGAQDTVKRLYGEFQDAESVEFIAIDNTLEPQEISMEQLFGLMYDKIGEGIEATANRLYPIAKKGLPYAH